MLIRSTAAAARGLQVRGAPSREHVTSRLCARLARFGRLCAVSFSAEVRGRRAISRLELEANVRLNVRYDSRGFLHCRDLDLGSPVSAVSAFRRAGTDFFHCIFSSCSPSCRSAWHAAHPHRQKAPRRPRTLQRPQRRALRRALRGCGRNRYQPPASNGSNRP